MIRGGVKLCKHTLQALYKNGKYFKKSTGKKFIEEKIARRELVNTSLKQEQQKKNRSYVLSLQPSFLSFLLISTTQKIRDHFLRD